MHIFKNDQLTLAVVHICIPVVMAIVLQFTFSVMEKMIVATAAMELIAQVKVVQ